MPSGHTVKSFDEELGALRGLVSQMGGQAEAQIASAIQAIVARDPDSAPPIVARDKAIDALEKEIEQLAITVIARRAPMADDLRDVIAAMKIASIIERIADYAKNIAKRSTVLAASTPIEPVVIIPEIGRAVAAMVKSALDAYVSRDPEMALQVCDRDQQVDDLYNSLFRSLLTYMMENPHLITPSTHLLFIAKNLERIGDHATNIAEIVYYSVKGQMPGERTKGDSTSYSAVVPGQ